MAGANKLREVLIVVSNVKTPDVYLMRPYPNPDVFSDGKVALFRTPIYKVFLEGKDRDGHAVKKAGYYPKVQRPSPRDRLP